MAHPDNQPARRGRFIPRLGPTLAMLVALAILLTLGTWQLQRRAWKLDLITAIDERTTVTPLPLATIVERYENGGDVRYTAVTITGRYDHANEAHVFGTLGPIPGYFIFTPLITDRLALADRIYVNRGFVPQDHKQPAMREDGQISERVTIKGLFRYSEERTGVAKLVAPIDQPEANIWYTRDPVRLARHFFADEGPGPRWYIDSIGTENAAPYPRGGTTRIDFNNRHLEYALTWYGLAMALIGVWLVYSRSNGGSSGGGNGRRG